ncbi:hypothetical protein J6590_027617, partial [Homalodisca vitripennis]
KKHQGLLEMRLTRESGGFKGSKETIGRRLLVIVGFKGRLQCKGQVPSEVSSFETQTRIVISKLRRFS